MKRGMAYSLAFAMAATTIAQGNFALAAEQGGEVTATSEQTKIEPKAQVLKEYTIHSNPLVPQDLKDENGDSIFCGDPSILVDGDTVYLYTGHDQGSVQGTYVMPDYLCFSTQDFKTWKYYGSVLDMKDVEWTNDNTSAWAGQVMRFHDKYYMLYCSWDKTAEGKQSIGVAIADNPTGPFVDQGAPFVQGTFTTDQSSNWDDIDPTGWIEKDENGEEHFYVMWGNFKLFACEAELKDDKLAVKDVNGDGEITFGKQSAGATAKTADVIERTRTTDYTEAPWIYRKQDANGNYTGPYYIFHAYKYPEEMAYMTTDNILDGDFTEPQSIMDLTATSDTNHMAVFDFQGKTWFVYHDGMKQGGFGQRRIPCITELKWNEDGSVQTMKETVSGQGVFDTELSTLYSYNGKQIFHEDFSNTTSQGTGEYPLCNVKVGDFTASDELSGKWVLTDSLLEGEGYVSIQAENKPGFYITANSDGSATLSHTDEVSDDNKKLQTFKQVKGLASENGISFESVSQPGKYLGFLAGSLYLVDDSHTVDATFFKDQAPAEALTKEGASAENELVKLEAGTDSLTEVKANENGDYQMNVSPADGKVNVKVTFSNEKGFAAINGDAVGIEGTEGSKTVILTSGEDAKVAIDIYAENGEKKTITLNIVRDVSLVKADFSKFESVKVLNFENQDDGVLTTKNVPGGEDVVDANVALEYTDGVHDGKAAKLSGAYGLKLLDNLSSLGESFSVSFWMNPTVIKGGVDPVLAIGTFSPEYWINVTHTDRGVWAHANDAWYDNNTNGTPYTAGVWQHVVLVVDNGAASLYRDGNEIEFTNRNGSVGEVPTGLTAQSGAAVYFGVNRWDAIFEGAVDEAIIFKGALGKDEIFALTSGLKTAADFTSTYTEPVKPSTPSTPAQDSVTSTAGVKKGKTFTAGNFTYKVITVAKKTVKGGETVSTKTGKVTITGLSKKGKKAATLTVPATVKKGAVAKYKITAIAASAFKGAKAKTITLNKNIKKLPKNAFANCKKLTTLKLKAKLSSVNKTAFKGCTKKITVSGTSKAANKKLIKKVYKNVK